ncbi:hypothetical protein ACFPU0_16750 [Pseudomonas sp. GCM10022186]|uniref:hypothetical protein n=1 Tax=Pseudomonas sp. GCM10022186 TaxID=3252650 RepID=UPI0036156D14
MKSAITTTAFSSLLFSVVALTSLQAFSASLQPADQQPLLMLAEGGSDRLVHYRELQAQRMQTADDESQRFATLVEEKPTAAGSGTAGEEAGAVANPAAGDESHTQDQGTDYQY